VRERARAKRADPSIIDKLIQDELLAFTSLDQLDDPLNPSSSAVRQDRLDKRPSVGARPLDAGSFNDHLENPSQWFSEEEEEAQPTSFFGRASLEAADLRKRSDPHELANLLETEDDPGAATGRVLLPAQDVASMLETELAGVSDRPNARASLSDLSQRRGGKAPPPPPPAQAEPAAVAPATKGSTGSTKYVVIALVVILGAAAAWFGTR
jgi:hypothetical protein